VLRVGACVCRFPLPEKFFASLRILSTSPQGGGDDNQTLRIRFYMTNDLQQRRLQVARDHMRLEITHEWEAVLATFEHPHYDINDGQAVFDGRDAVLRYFTQSRIPFPDQGNEVLIPMGRRIRRSVSRRSPERKTAAPEAGPRQRHC